MSGTLLVASAGGHVDELMIHATRLGVDWSDAVWVTSRTPQTEALLRDQTVFWSPRIGSGELTKAVMHLPTALRVQRRLRPRRIITTGALLAVPYMFAASLTGCEVIFIDSATRITGPSATGRFARRFTRAQLYTQNGPWLDPRWKAMPSVFDAFEVDEHALAEPPSVVRRAVVSLGSERWPFPLAIESAGGLLAGADVTWQVGANEAIRDGHPLRQWVPADELRRAIRAADVVIMHAGVGSILAALDEGKVPVVLARRASRGEHVDDHQTEIVDLLVRRNLAVSVEPEDLTHEHLMRAATSRVRRRALDGPAR